MRLKILARFGAVVLGGFLSTALTAWMASWHAERLLALGESSSPSSTPTVTQGTAAKPPALTLEERADIFMARKSYDDAADYYYRALKQSGFSDPRLWNKLGIVYQQQEKYGAARRAYNQAIRHRPDFAEPWNNLGTTYFLENRFKKSLKYYLKAIELNPNSAPFHLNLGTSYYYLKKFKEAVEEYRMALTLDPSLFTARSSLTGTVVRAQGVDAEYYFYLAKTFASIGRVEDAIRYLRRAFEDGFKDLKQLDKDADFQKISQYSAYVELRQNPPVPIKD